MLESPCQEDSATECNRDPCDEPQSSRRECDDVDDDDRDNNSTAIGNARDFEKGIRKRLDGRVNGSFES